MRVGWRHGGGGWACKVHRLFRFWVFARFSLQVSFWVSLLPLSGRSPIKPRQNERHPRMSCPYILPGTPTSRSSLLLTWFYVNQVSQSFSPRLVGTIRRSARWLRRQRIRSKSSSVSGLETAGCSTLPGTAQPSNGSGHPQASDSTAQTSGGLGSPGYNALVNPACRAPGLYNMGYLSILDQPVSLTLIGSAHAQSLLACMCCEKRGTNKYSVVYA